MQRARIRVSSCFRQSSTNFRARNCISSRHLSIQSRPPLSVPYNTGQPTHETRPHYLPTAGNITPAISAIEYYNRRLELAKKMPARSVAILVGSDVKYSSGSVFYDFQQNTDLYYMTGWLEPNSVAIIEKLKDNGDEEDVQLHMLVPAKNRQTELWEGERSGLQGAYDYFNADLVEDIDKARPYIEQLLSRNDHVFWDDKSATGSKGVSANVASRFSSFFSIGDSNSNSDSIAGIIRKSKLSVHPLSGKIAEQRSVKSLAEIKVMHVAAQISSRAINKAMAKVGSDSPIYTEKTLAKYLDYQFVKGGCDKQAYIPVVASGKNALTIHYTRNDDLLYRDEMVFVDAGGKLGGYCADISRTWPNTPAGFTDPQRDIYEAVLNTNRKCIDMCDESRDVSLHDIHEFSVKSLLEELKNLTGFQGITSQDVSRTLYPHYIGHHLGLDLHDIPSVSRFKKLVEGNVITIEPGLYIPQDDKWPKHYQGIGVRVEDDIVVGKTNDEIINLSSGCVKEVADIESLISSGSTTTPGIDEELVVLDI
ncbi:peptidase M24, structural domain-containing protein [Scheffersomyces xylosifermentans]|uniref:peptidase M24, structural domain-containing protein n=1 Tax=Scheffersomyces xylosifermentans TaxID=1304137 RepID=UPI00315D3153